MFFKMFLTSWSTLPRMSQATSEKCTERYSTEDPSTTIWRWSPLLTSLTWTSCSKLQRQAGLFAILAVISGEYCGYSPFSLQSCPLQEAQLRHPDHQWPQHYLGVETDHLQRQPEPGHLLPGQNVHSPSEGLGQSLDQTWELSFCLQCDLQVTKNVITCFYSCRLGCKM